MTDDPFSDAADPYPPRAELATSKDGVEGPATLSRRATLKLLVTASIATELSGCAHTSIGCEPRAGTTNACAHRFCRYYHGTTIDRRSRQRQPST